MLLLTLLFHALLPKSKVRPADKLQSEAATILSLVGLARSKQKSIRPWARCSEITPPPASLGPQNTKSEIGKIILQGGDLLTWRLAGGPGWPAAPLAPHNGGTAAGPIATGSGTETLKSAHDKLEFPGLDFKHLKALKLVPEHKLSGLIRMHWDTFQPSPLGIVSHRLLLSTPAVAILACKLVARKRWQLTRQCAQIS